jgi:hypothetical protein
MHPTVRVLALAAAVTALHAGGACAARRPESGAGGISSEMRATERSRREAAADAYDRGLERLLELQRDGVWTGSGGASSEELTALAALCLFERPGGARGRDTSVARHAVDFVAGRIDGAGFVEGTARQTYALGLATTLLAASGRIDVRPTLARAADRLRTFQVTERSQVASFGGFGYGHAPSGRRPAASNGDDADRPDLSNTVFALEGLRAAGATRDDPAFRDALAFLGNVQHIPAESAGAATRRLDPDAGGGSYRPGGRSTAGMTSALLHGYRVAGVAPTDPRVQAALGWTARNFDLDSNRGMSAGSSDAGRFHMLAMTARALRGSGPRTLTTPSGAVDWRTAIEDRLLRDQRADGSWVNDDATWLEGDPVVATSFALLALAACR